MSFTHNPKAISSSPISATKDSTRVTENCRHLLTLALTRAILNINNSRKGDVTIFNKYIFFSFLLKLLKKDCNNLNVDILKFKNLFEICSIFITWSPLS